MTRKSRKQDPKATWEWALGDLACGRRSEKCVRAFDGLTNDMLRTGGITMDEFMGAQVVIGAAYAGAKQLRKAKGIPMRNMRDFDRL